MDESGAKEFLSRLANSPTTVEHDLESATSLLSNLIEDDGIGQAGDERDVVILRGLFGSDGEVED